MQNIPPTLGVTYPTGPDMITSETIFDDLKSKGEITYVFSKNSRYMHYKFINFIMVS